MLAAFVRHCSVQITRCDFLGSDASGTGRMMTIKSLNGVVNKTSTKSVEPWIHVRAMLIAKLWIGLKALSVQGTLNFTQERNSIHLPAAALNSP